MRKEWFSAQEVAELLSMTAQGVRLRANNNNWTKRKKLKGKGCEYHINSLPPETQAALIRRNHLEKTDEVVTPLSLDEKYDIAERKTHFTYSRESLWTWFDTKKQPAKDKAMKRLKAILAVLTLRDSGEYSFDQACKQIANQIKAEAKEGEDVKGLGWTSLRDIWHGKAGKPGLKLYKREDWLAALVPRYTGRTATAAFSEEAWDYFKAIYLRLEKPTLSACYHRMERIAPENNWVIPSKKTVERLVNELPIAGVVLRREGHEALMRLFPHMERTVRDMHALDHINGDGYQHNVFVRFPDGEIVRPKTWFWQDVFSRMILGYRVGKTENTDTIRVSFGDIVESFGIPNHATIDNTRAAANKAMTGGLRNRYRFKVKDDDPQGLFVALGVDVHWTGVDQITRKGHGQAKPIERAFGVGGLGEYVDKAPDFAGAYTGANPTAKPENYGSVVIEYDVFLEVLEREIKYWNQKEGRRTEMAAGVKSFQQVFNESYAKSTIRKATESQRRLWMLQSEPVMVKRDGTISTKAGSATGVGANRYVSDTLLQYRGQKVIVRFDPDDLHKDISVYTLDNLFICDAQLDVAVGFRDTVAAREYNKQRNRFGKATKIAAEAQTKMDIQAAARLQSNPPEPETPAAGAVQLEFQKSQKVVNGFDLAEDEQPANIYMLESPKKEAKEDYQSNFYEAMRDFRPKK